MPLGSPIGVLTLPTRVGRGGDTKTPQHAVMQVRIDRDKEAQRLLDTEALATSWSFVRGGDPEKDEAPKPNLTGMINFVWEQVENVDYVHHVMELQVQLNAMSQMRKMILDMSESEDEEEQEWSMGEGPDWMTRAYDHVGDLVKAITASMNEAIKAPVKFQ